MTAYSGNHYQKPVNDWPRAAARQPAGTWMKCIDQVQQLDEGKRVNPGLLALLRHFDWGWQKFNLGALGAYKEHARKFFNSFIDGTFMQYAHNVDAVEGLNEYNATSHSAAERRERILWAQAACIVWATEFRTRPGLGHIRLVVGNVAVGNDMPLETARAVYDYGAIAGYHSYVPYRRPSSGQWLRDVAAASIPQLRELGPGPRRYTATRASMRGSVEPYDLQVEVVRGEPAAEALVAKAVAPPGVMADEWPWLSGRFATMDEHFRAHGIFVDWLSTEGGPIGYYDWGGLDPMGGWRHPDVCGGDIDQLLAVCGYWQDQVARWNAAHGGRMLGNVLFNSGGADNEWKWFEVAQPALDRQAQYMASYVPPVKPAPDPEPEPEPEQRTWSKLVYLLPQQATPAQYDAVQAVAYPTRSEIAFSADSAFARPLNVKSHTVIVYDVPAWGGQQALEAWVNKHYRYEPATVIEYRDWPGFSLAPPIRAISLQITSPWRAPRTYEGVPREHEGIDLRAVGPDGRPVEVVAAAAGVVDRRAYSEKGYGHYVRLRHQVGDGTYYTWYAHLSSIDAEVQVGKQVAVGQRLGIAGTTGNSSGIHLHFNLEHVGHGTPGNFIAGDWIDPTPWLFG